MGLFEHFKKKKEVETAKEPSNVYGSQASADPFYSEDNISRLKKSIAQMEATDDSE